MLKCCWFLILSILLWVLPLGASPSSGITYHGRIIKPDGAPLEGENVQFRVQLRTAGSENCLLFEEIQSFDMRNSAGIFSVTINDGSGTRVDSSGYSLDQVFANRSQFSVPTANCVAGVGTTTNWSPNEADGRRLQTYFKDATMTNWEPLPSSMISFVPMAIEAKQLQGHGPRNFLRFNNATASDAASAVELTLADFNDLLDLIAGTSAKYTKAGQLNGAALPSLTGGQAVRWNGSAWQAYTPMTSADETDPSVKGFAKANLPVCGANEFLSASGINTWSCVAVSGSAGGTVTSIVGGTGLTGGTITSTGTFAIDVGTTANKIVQLDGTAKLPAVDGSALTNITGANILGTIDGSVAIDTSGDIETTGNVISAGVSTTTVAAKTLELYKPNNAFKTTIIPLSTLAADYTLTLPPDDGAANQVLQTNGSGVLTWATPLTSGTLPVATTGAQGIMQVGTGLAVTTGTVSADFGSTTGKVVEGDDDRLNPAPVIGDALKIPRVTSGGIAYENVTAATVVTSGGGVVNGGNTLGAALTIGTNDSQSLAFETNNATAMTILSDGKVGIGTTNPGTELDITKSDVSPILRLMNTSSTAARYPQVMLTNFSSTFGGSPALNMFESRGSSASPVAVQAGDNLGMINAYGGNGTNFGSAAASIYFTADGNFSATSQPTSIKFFTTPSGTTTLSEQMRIDSSGNVGIGTTSPTTKLEVNGTVKATSFEGAITSTGANVVGAGGGAITSVRIEDPNTAAGGFPQLLLRDRGPASADDEMWSMRSSDTGTFGLGTLDNAETAYSEKFSILRDGSVGIGTSSPTHKLDVAGTFRTTGAVYNTSGLTYLRSAGNSNGITPVHIFQRARNTLASPQAVQAADNLGALEFGGYDGTVYSDGWDGGATIIAIASQNWSATANGTSMTFNTTPDNASGHLERMRIDASGKVGIATTTPGEMLEVAGNVKLNPGGAYKPYTLATDGNGIFLRDDTNTRYPFKINAGAYDDAFVISSTGKIGMGTASPIAQSKLTSTGSISVNGADGDFTQGGNRAIMDFASPVARFGSIVGGGAAVQTAIWANNAEAVRINASGNVGIGTTSPQTPLDVKGVIRANNNSTTDYISIYNDGGAHVAGENSSLGNLYLSGGVIHFRPTANGTTGMSITPASNLMNFWGDDNWGIRGTSSGGKYYTDVTGAYGANSGGGFRVVHRLSATDVVKMIVDYDGTGNVGIGTSTPANLLDVSKNQNATTAARVLNVNNGASGGAGYYAETDAGQIFMAQGSSTNNSGYSLIESTSAAPMYIRKNNATGDIIFTTGAAYAERLRINSAGNVGVGTTSPAALLHTHKISGANFSYLTNDGNTGTDRTAIWFARNYTAAPNWAGIGMDTDGSLRFTGSSSLAAPGMVLDDNNNVGIGTTTPQSKLSVVGDLSVYGAVSVASVDNIGAAAWSSGIKSWDVHANGTVSSPNPFSQTSDRRLKTEIQPIENSLEKINQLSGVSYYWIDKDTYGPKKQIGVIAQEVEAVFPEAVQTSDKGYKSVGYTALIGPVIAAIKELYSKWLEDHARIQELEKEVSHLKTQLESQQNRFEERLKTLEKAQRSPAAQ